MDQVKIQRLLRLLLLLSGSRRYDLETLSKKFSVGRRTLFRYLESIEAAGFVLSRTDGTYLLQTESPATGSLQKLLHFSEEEAYILFQTLSLIEGETPVKERLVCKLNTLYDLKALAQQKQKNSLEIVQKLHAAIKEKKQARLFAYRSSNSQTISDRIIEPFDFLPDYSAVWCYEPESKTSKQFKIARMQNIEPLPDNWRHEQQHTLPFIDAFRMAATAPLATVTATLSLKACNLLNEEYPLANPYIIAQEQEYLLQIPVADFNGIGRFVLGLAGEVKVLSPDSFIDFLKEKINKINW